MCSDFSCFGLLLDFLDVDTAPQARTQRNWEGWTRQGSSDVATPAEWIIWADAVTSACAAAATSALPASCSSAAADIAAGTAPAGNNPSHQRRISTTRPLATSKRFQGRSKEDPVLEQVCALL